MNQALHILRLVLPLAVALHAGLLRAEGTCEPQLSLSTGEQIEFHQSASDVRPRLEAAFKVDYLFPGKLSVMDLGSAGSEVTLREPLQLGAFRPGGSVLEPVGRLVFDGRKDGEVVVLHGRKRYLLYLNDGVALNAAGSALAVKARETDDTFPVLQEGSRLRRNADNTTSILKGSTVSWSINSGQTLTVVLAEASRLSETGLTEAPVKVDVLRPPRVLPGAMMEISVAAGEFDFRSQPYLVCFSLPRKDFARDYVPAPEARFVSQSAGVAKFLVRVPDELANAGARNGASYVGWRLARLFSRKTEMRVFGFDRGSNVVIDARQDFQLADWWVALVALALLTFFTTLLSLLFLRKLNPVALVKRLVLNPGGKSYSLADVQILMWTFLVLFALLYVWLGNGELLVVSTNFQILLGISAATKVAARMVDAGKPSPSPSQDRIPSLRDLVTDRNGASFELLRFQMLGFTLFTWIYSLVSVLNSEGLPDIPQHLYTLMGISSLAYVGGKIPGADTTSPAAGAGSAPGSVGKPDATIPDSRGAPAAAGEPRVALTSTQIDELQAALGVPVTGLLDVVTRDAVVRFKQQQNIVPVNADVGPLLLGAAKEARAKAS